MPGLIIQRALKALQDSEGYGPLNLHLDVSGFTTQSSNGRPGGEVRIDAAGSGDPGGALLIIQGWTGRWKKAAKNLLQTFDVGCEHASRISAVLFLVYSAVRDEWV
jgi:hypothetical protein